MKNTIRMLLGLLILASIVLSACAPPPPPITKDQLQIAEQEAIAAEEAANELCASCKKLESEIAAKQAELDDLKAYKSELERK
jgi:outer membrane murein-binding lipoprotein Lpp